MVVSGDHPTYRMIIRIGRDSYIAAQRSGRDKITSLNTTLMTRDWLVPFPAFFHFEKQCFYALCREMLNVVGLREMEACTGLSAGQRDGIVKHSHAWNNRAFVFNICTAILIHVTEVLQSEVPDVKERVLNLLSRLEKGGEMVQPSKCSAVLQDSL